MRWFLAFLLIATPAAAQHTPVMQSEHDAFTALASTAETVIPAGQSITYSTPTAAQFIRVEGHLTVAAALDVDTILVMPGGTLEVLPGAVITIRDMGPLDTVRDPSRLSRGIVSHGSLIMHGDPKDARARVAADPMAGDGALTLETAPTGWQAGDRIVIAGTRYPAHGQPQDETRTIVGVIGNIVTLDQPLTYDHDAPRPDLKTWVGNFTRSTVIRTENGAALPPGQRGHVMCMHAGCTVHGVLFEHMGRTDKSQPFSSENIAGRYSLHCHRASTSCDFAGNAVWTSPGWGIVHHDSDATVTGNAVYGAFGAGIVAESGNETGTWTDNIVIWSEGIPDNVGSWIDAKNASALPISANFNLGINGVGYWFQGRMIEASGNVAASATEGFTYFHRGQFGDGLMQYVDADQFAFPEALYHRPRDDGFRVTNPERLPILTFANNEAFAVRTGFSVVKSGPWQHRDVHSRLVGFTAWNVRRGVHLEYTGHYTFTDLDLVGVPGAEFGIKMGSNVIGQTFVRPSINGFAEGIHALRLYTFAEIDAQAPDYRIVGATFANNGADLVNILPGEVVGIPAPMPIQVAFDPLIYAGAGVVITGTITDALGSRQIGAHGDAISMGVADFLRLAERHGWCVEDGQRLTRLPMRFSDRLSGLSHEIIATITVAANVDPNHPAYAGVPEGCMVVAPGPTIEELLAQIAVLEAQNAALVADLNTALSTIAQLEARISAAVQALTGP